MHVYEGAHYDCIADMLLISSSTARRIVCLFSVMDDVLPKEQQHGPSRSLGRQEELVMKWLLENPGIHLDELQLKLQQFTGILISLTTIFKTIQRLEFTRKMIRHVVHCQDELRRCEFMEDMSYLNPNMIIWINEMGSDHRQSSRQLGHHLRGLTPTDAVISIHGQHISTIAALSPRGIEDIEVYSETTNGETFAGFVQRCIVPIMLPFSGSNPRSVLVLDNASIRHVQEVHQMIKGCSEDDRVPAFPAICA